MKGKNLLNEEFLLEWNIREKRKKTWREKYSQYTTKGNQERQLSKKHSMIIKAM